MGKAEWSVTVSDELNDAVIVNFQRFSTPYPEVA